jgi:hypothetical protein
MMRIEAHRYLYLFEKLEWKVNTTIFEFNSPLQGLYIIREGSVVLKAMIKKLIPTVYNDMVSSSPIRKRSW